MRDSSSRDSSSAPVAAPEAAAVATPHAGNEAKDEASIHTPRDDSTHTKTKKLLVQHVTTSAHVRTGRNLHPAFKSVAAGLNRRVESAVWSCGKGLFLIGDAASSNAVPNLHSDAIVLVIKERLVLEVRENVLDVARLGEKCHVAIVNAISHATPIVVPATVAAVKVGKRAILLVESELSIVTPKVHANTVDVLVKVPHFNAVDNSSRATTPEGRLGLLEGFVREVQVRTLVHVEHVDLLRGKEVVAHQLVGVGVERLELELELIRIRNGGRRRRGTRKTEEVVIVALVVDKSTRLTFGKSDHAANLEDLLVFVEKDAVFRQGMNDNVDNPGFRRLRDRSTRSNGEGG